MTKIFSTPGLVTALSVKGDGNMRIKPSGDFEIDKQAKLNRQKFIESLGIAKSKVIAAQSEHRANVVRIEAGAGSGIIPDADALITGQPNVLLTLTVADCLAVYIYDPQKQVVALAHAGWRGLAAEVIENVIQEFITFYGTDSSNLSAKLSPAIGGCHYSVGNEVTEKFAGYPEAFRFERGISYLDIKTIAKEKLARLGVQPENIEISPECTYELPGKYFSFRRDKPAILEAMLAVFGRLCN